MRVKTLSILAVLSSLLMFSTAQSGQESGDVVEIADRVASWQLDNLDSSAGIRTFIDRSAEPNGWIRAAFYIGLNRWHATAPNPRYRDALFAMAEESEWSLRERYWHADDQAIAQVYLALEDANIAPTREAFDQVLAMNPDNSLEFVKPKTDNTEGGCQKRWCWSDALFMAPPAWAALSRVTGDQRYVDYAIHEYLATQDYLFDKQEKLYYRDSRFFDRRTEHGNKVFWSRGNGWVFAGLPLLLEQLPAGHDASEGFLVTFREMAHTFKNIQTAEGLWAPSLLDFEYDPSPETSGSAFVVFGLAWGVNRGYLDSETYLPVIKKGWHALVSAVDENGKLGWVQQVGNAPDEVRPGDSQFYGVGAFLLAANEINQLHAKLY
jgi:rhamnogalacturonyl hydrolase YesR